MPLIISECGEYDANGCYYQENNNPPIYVQTNRSHMITEREQTINQGYGACYKQKVWILQKINTCNSTPCVLYVSYSNRNYQCKLSFSSNAVEWKSIGGSSPVPKVRNGMLQSPQNVKMNGNQATKRRCDYKNLPRKRTFRMLRDCDDDFDEMNSNCIQNNNEIQQPSNKRMKLNHNQEHNGYHGNQCGFGAMNQSNQCTNTGNWKFGNQNETQFRFNNFN